MASHGAAERAKGVTDEMLNEVYAVVGLANMTNRLANAYDVPVDDAFRRDEGCAEVNLRCDPLLRKVKDYGKIR